MSAQSSTDQSLEHSLQREDRMRKSDVAHYLGLNPKTVEPDRENDDCPFFVQ
jgi:predicted ArsR family transcriptional regulator